MMAYGHFFLHGIPEPAYLPSPMIPEMIPTEPIQRIAETNDATARWQSIGGTDREASAAD
jgi:hypothetical protein